MSCIFYPYLGMPGAMLQLPSANGEIDESESFGESATTLLSGATAVWRRLNLKRSYSLPFDSLTPPDADLIRGLYAGLFGRGPFVYVNPSVVNMLPLDVASCGVRSQAAPGWVSSSGALAVDLSTLSPIAGSAALKWSPAASATLQPGSVANTADTTSAPVYLPSEPVAVSLQIMASAAATFSWQLVGFDVNGAVTGSPVSVPVNVTTSWQWVDLAAVGHPNLASAVFVLPRLVAPASGLPGTVWIAAVQLEYADAGSAWQSGQGSPRVQFPASPGRTVPQFGYSSHMMQLAEA